MKVTPEEEARLLQLAEAQRVSIPRLLVEAALSPQGETPTQRRDAIAKLFGLHRLLAGIASNVNQIARVANASGDIRPETVATLQAVRRTAERIDDAIDGLAL